MAKTKYSIGTKWEAKFTKGFVLEVTEVLFDNQIRMNNGKVFTKQFIGRNYNKVK